MIIFKGRENNIFTVVPVAQRIRHLTTNQGIVGSNPTGDVFDFFSITKDQKNITEKYIHPELNRGPTAC